MNNIITNSAYTSRLINVLDNTETPKKYTQFSSLVGRAICLGSAVIGIPLFAAYTAVVATINIALDIIGITVGGIISLVSLFQWNRPVKSCLNDLTINGVNLGSLIFHTLKREISAICGIFVPSLFLNPSPETDKQ